MKNHTSNIVIETVESLNRNGFKAIYAENRRVALRAIFEEIPSKATIGAGDSLTLRELGVFEELKKERLYTVLAF